MNKNKLIALLFYFILWHTVIVQSQQMKAPKSYGPIPSARQMKWQEKEYIAFFHFNMNTFTNKEWGYGDESPLQFNPTDFDANQWIRIIKQAGMKSVILTTKHHDGFCLWPSKYTEHSIKNSPYKNGKGDIVKELADACRSNNIGFGIYLSPWDRNHAQYGTPEYINYFYNQMKELLTNYGDIAEVWFDGANGGDGYYGGAKEVRKIDAKTYYKWDSATALIRKYQPDAVIFSDAGPDVRWVGTEKGYANETNWSLLNRDKIFPGYQQYQELLSGHPNGKYWVPAEVNTSTRPGWYYHPQEDNAVKTHDHFVKIYYESIGRNGVLLLNIPPDTRGLINPNDSVALTKLKHQIEKDFSNNLITKQTKIKASSTRNNDNNFGVNNLKDNDNDTYWATNDDKKTAYVDIEFEKPIKFNRLLLQEYIKLGQRIAKFTISINIKDKWKIIDAQTTIGYKRILKFDTYETNKIRLNIIDSKAPPILSNLGVYHAL